MAIDWGRMAKGVATGYLSAKIANTEANDKLNADIIKAAGLRFHEKTYPEWEEKEKFKKAAKNIAEDKPKIEQKGLMAAPQPAQEEMI